MCLCVEVCVCGVCLPVSVFRCVCVLCVCVVSACVCVLRCVCSVSVC